MTWTPEPPRVVRHGHGQYDYIFRSWMDYAVHTEVQSLGLSGHVFRGQGAQNWKVRSSLDRLAETSGGLDVSAHLEYFRAAALEQLGDESLTLEDDVLWAIGQHEGLATPLL